MIELIFIILVIAGLLPALGIFYLYLYKKYIDIRKKEFENKGNVVLIRSKIEDILEQSTPSQLIKIFRSAVGDHSEVEGVRYYTQFPFGLKIVMAHDDHRRAFIAHEIGKTLINEFTSEHDMDLCTDSLLCLTDYVHETYYTQLIAWNSLSKLAKFRKHALIETIGVDYLMECILKDFLTGIGVVRFIFKIKEITDTDNVMRDMINEMIFYTIEKGSLPLLALLVIKLTRSRHFNQFEKRDFMNRLPDSPKFNRFLMHMDALSFGFTQEELTEGLMNLGLQSPPYSRKNTEGEIVEILSKDFIEELYVSTAYMMNSYDSENSRLQFPDFIWC